MLALSLKHTNAQQERDAWGDNEKRKDAHACIDNKVGVTVYRFGLKINETRCEAV